MALTEGRVAKPERRWDCRRSTPYCGSMAAVSTFGGWLQVWSWRVSSQFRTSSLVRVDYCKSAWRESGCSLPTQRYS